MQILLLLRIDYIDGKRDFHDEKYDLITWNIEAFFKKLVKKAERDGYDTDHLLELPDALGNTVFGIASNTSKDIIEYILSRPNIDLRYINLSFDSPVATFVSRFTEACFD